MKKFFKEYGTVFSSIIVMFFVVGISMGILLLNVRQQDERIKELEEVNGEIYQELVVTKDILNQIQMRNEAIKYIDELEE